MRNDAKYWVTPVIGVVIGIAYLIGFWLGGDPVIGLAALAFMTACSIAIALAGRRSETVRGLLDHRDERITAIDLRATAATAIAMIIADLIGFVIELAHGHDSSPYVIIGVVGGLSYIGAVAYLRLRT